MQRKGEPEKYKEMVYLILYKGKCKQRKKRVIAIVRRKARMEEKDSKQSGGSRKQSRKVVVERRKADISEGARRRKDRIDYSIAQAKRARRKKSG